METATKKRGRPRSVLGELASNPVLQDGKTERTILNQLYAMECIMLDEDRFKPFFVTDRGKFRRQGIAEQIGRMKEEGIASDEELIELTETCMEDYTAGKPIKEIEKGLRQIRKLFRST